MSNIKTYVFLDLETTGMPQEESNRTKITEISLIAVKREHILETRPGAAPRVKQKLTMCLNPARLVQPGCSEVTGLCNDLLEREPYFDIKVFTIINNFLSVLTKPVCLIAQNGLNFDYPILKNQLEKLGVNLQEDLLCADCFHGFYDILKEKNSVHEVLTNDLKVTSIKDTSFQNKDEVSEVDFVKLMKERNETTPKKTVKSNKNNYDATEIPQKDKCFKKINRKVIRKFPWSKGEKPTLKYRLKDIYERVLNRPALEAHQAESDCIMALEISVVLQKDFVDWVDNNNCLFLDIKPMTVGVPLGE